MVLIAMCSLIFMADLALVAKLWAIKGSLWTEREGINNAFSCIISQSCKVFLLLVSSLGCHFTSIKLFLEEFGGKETKGPKKSSKLLYYWDDILHDYVVWLLVYTDDWLVCCLLTRADLWKRVPLRCSFTSPLLSWCTISSLFKENNNVVVLPFPFHIFIPLANLWFIRLRA